jgi:hypothetical protein
VAGRSATKLSQEYLQQFNDETVMDPESQYTVWFSFWWQSLLESCGKYFGEQKFVATM